MGEVETGGVDGRSPVMVITLIPVSEAIGSRIVECASRHLPGRSDRALTLDPTTAQGEEGI